jgi:protein-S-isoprenylcysteine O-methyltransferase Ste14
MTYLIIVLLWLAWGLLHSLMISTRFVDLMRRLLGDRFRFYRLIFNLTALVTLIPPVIYTGSVREHLLFEYDGLLAVVRWSMLAVAALLFVLGARNYDTLQFLGFRQILSGSSHTSLSGSSELATDGLLGVVRHPWYLGALLFVWSDSQAVYLAGLITKTILTLYLIVGTILEERKLVAEFGDSYREYQGRVSMLLPFKYVGRLFARAGRW